MGTTDVFDGEVCVGGTPCPESVDGEAVQVSPLGDETCEGGAPFTQVDVLAGLVRNAGGNVCTSDGACPEATPPEPTVEVVLGDDTCDGDRRDA